MSLISSVFLTPILLSSFASSSSEPLAEVVYSARFYYQGSRKSHFQIYVSNLDGTKRRQLTSGTRKKSACFWLDRNRIAYVETLAVRDSFDVKVPSYADVQVNSINIRTGKSMMLKKLRTSSAYCRVNQSRRLIEIGDQIWQWNALGVVNRSKEVSIDDPGVLHENTDTGETMDGRIPTPSGKDVFMLSTKHGDVNTPDTGPSRFGLTVKTSQFEKKFTLSGCVLDAAIPRSESRLFLITVPYPSRTDDSHYVQEIDVKSGTMKTLLKDVGNIKFRSGLDLWCASQTEGMAMRPLKDGRQLWVNYLYGGSISSGKRWTIADGLVNVDSFEIQPSQ